MNNEKLQKLSIITINLNNCSGLQKTIESVINQTFQNYEYLVIDGGSTDGSIDVIKKYKDKINYWVSEPDNGIYNAMNKGILKAQGDYCLFLNSGDYLHDPGIVNTVFKKGMVTDLVYGNTLFVEKDKEWLKTHSEKLTFGFFLTNNLAHSSTFIKTELFKTVGLYNEKNKILSDWEFFILAINKHNCSYQHVPMIISYFDTHGISSDPKNEEVKKTEKTRILKTYFPSFIDDYNELESMRSELNNLKLSKFFKYGYKLTQQIKYKLFSSWRTL